MFRPFSIALTTAVAAYLYPLAPLHAQAGGFIDPAAIEAEVARFTGAGMGQPGGAALPIDRRLRLARCAAPLALSWRGQSQLQGQDMVVVQCPGGWRLFVALSAGGQSAVAAPVIGPPVIGKGDAVTIVVRGDGYSVSQGGEALEPGAPGAWIRVRAGEKSPGDRNEALRARVVRPGLVEMTDE
ncbi:flagella basal body P-ring formation protein FlgA [Novosphingobium sp.]|uniref:flagella basal body P-ring formation protein FlgA n=1 Tax=Novosphingobium sp. TaxID=1874826 RepID=UPI0025FED344|nr:flagella basal body P-ring formation protein FlgA [Novosphingobium sp.]